jgi:hypothetical protein
MLLSVPVQADAVRFLSSETEEAPPSPNALPFDGDIVWFNPNPGNMPACNPVGYAPCAMVIHRPFAAAAVAAAAFDLKNICP